jgi:hypothetical protein
LELFLNKAMERALSFCGFTFTICILWMSTNRQSKA